METIITILGWVLFGALTTALVAFLTAAGWGAWTLGYQISTRCIRERRGWQKAVREGNHRVAQYAATVMSDTLGYGRDATLGEIIADTQSKINIQEQ